MEYRIAHTKGDFQNICLFRKNFFTRFLLNTYQRNKNHYDEKETTINFIAAEKEKIYANVRLIKSKKSSKKLNLPMGKYFYLSGLKQKNIHPVEFSQLIISDEITGNDVLIKLMTYIFKYAEKYSIKYLCTLANTGTDDSKSVRIMYRIAEIKNLIYPDIKTLPVQHEENNNTPVVSFYNDEIKKKIGKSFKFNYKQLQLLEKKGFQLPFSLQFYFKLGFQITSIPIYIKEYQRYVFPMLLEIEKTRFKSLKTDFNKEESLVTKKEINCRSANTIIQYVKAQNGNINKLLKGINFSEEYLIDENNWIDCRTVINLFRNARKLLKDDKFAYKMGFTSIQLDSIGIIFTIFKLFGNPLIVFKMVPTFIRLWNRAETFKTNIINKNKIEFIVGKPGILPTKDVCDFRMGICTAMPSIWNLKTKVYEDKCVRRGDPFCKFIVEWEPQRSILKYIYFLTIDKIKTLIKVKKILKQKYKLLKEKYNELNEKTNENINLNKLLNKKNQELQKVINNKIEKLESAYRKKISNNLENFNKEKNYIMENFTGIIAHEIKSSISSVNILYNRLKKEDLIEKSKQYLMLLIHLCNNKIRKQLFLKIINKIDMINENYKNINYTILKSSEIIKESIEICKLILNNYKMNNFKQEDINFIIEEYFNSKKDFFNKQNIKFKYNISKNISAAFVKHDILTIINNITLNSFNVLISKSNKKLKKIKINVYITNYKKSKYMVIEIEDNGPGIPVKYRPYIFNPFYTTSAKNLGLGLTFCKKIIKKYNGEIKLISAVNKGAIFKIYFPINLF